MRSWTATFLALSLFAVATAQGLQVGATVDFDRVSSGNPDLGCWDRGTVTGTTTIAGQTYYKIRNQAGTSYTIPSDPRWIRSVDPSSAGPAPDGTHPGPYRANTAPQTAPVGATPATATPPTGGPAGRWPAGTQVAFDRVEAQNPANGRWDEGVVVGLTPGGYVQIRGKNGILYRVTDDPRWIKPAGSALTGPRHDFSEPQNQATAQNPARPAGAATPLEGEWAVIQEDGATVGFGTTFNFVGPRWEQISPGGRAIDGPLSVSGSTVRMDGLATFQYTIQGNRLTLTTPGTTFVCERSHR